MASTFACFANTKEKTIITKLEYDIASRKKAFGVEYLNILEKATEVDKKEADLEACVDKAMADIRKIKEEIKTHQAEVEMTNEELEKKLKHANAAASAATASTPTSTTAVEQASSTPAPVPAAATVTTPTPTPVVSTPVPVAEAPVPVTETPAPVVEAPAP